MKARFAYPLVFLLPSAMVAFLSGVVVAGAGAGLLWLFVFGDNPWPGAADHALMTLATLATAFVLAMLLFAGYSFGKKRETCGGLSGRHLVLALAISVVLPAFVLLYEWQVGNLGAGASAG